VGNDRLNEVRQQETTGPGTKIYFPLFHFYVSFFNAPLSAPCLVGLLRDNSRTGHIYNLNLLFLGGLIFG
jgi:hypothetical protein